MDICGAFNVIEMALVFIWKKLPEEARGKTTRGMLWISSQYVYFFNFQPTYILKGYVKDETGMRVDVNYEACLSPSSKSNTIGCWIRVTNEARKYIFLAEIGEKEFNPTLLFPPMVDDLEMNLEPEFGGTELARLQARFQGGLPYFGKTRFPPLPPTATQDPC